MAAIECLGDQENCVPPPLKKDKFSESFTSPALYQCPLNLTSPSEFLSSLISPVCTLKEFFDEYWECKPLHIKAVIKDVKESDTTQSTLFKSYFKDLFNLDLLRNIAKKEELKNELDLVMCKYAYGCRTTYDIPGRVSYSKVKQMFHKEKMTLQFHQPQRFQEELWKILEMFERYFGCLVGSNVYMTPPNSQGLAPHYDDVEVFILQLEGSKVWKLYHPIKNLPNECSRDLSSAVMKTTKLIDEITLNPGDVLYFPRGTIHEAKVLEGVEHSTHITISTYHCHTFEEYISSSIPFIANQMNEIGTALRSGLPTNYYAKEVKERHKSLVSNALKVLNDAVLRMIDSNTMDQITCDFIANRLPPFKMDSSPKGKTPSLDCLIRMTHPHHVFISKGKGACDDEEFEDECYDDDDSDEEEAEVSTTEVDSPVFVYHSLSNDRSCHMVGTPSRKPEGLKFDPICWNSLVKLQEAKNEFVHVRDLNLPPLLGHDMLIALWSERIIETKDAADIC